MNDASVENVGAVFERSLSMFDVGGAEAGEPTDRRGDAISQPKAQHCGASRSIRRCNNRSGIGQTASKTESDH